MNRGDPIDVLIEAPAITRAVYGARTRRPAEGAAPEPGEETPVLSAVAQQVLVALSEDPNGRLEDIGQRLALKTSTVSYACTELEQAGMMTKGERPEGAPGRQQSRPLTAEGQQRAARLVAKVRKVLEDRAGLKTHRGARQG